MQVAILAQVPLRARDIID